MSLFNKFISFFVMVSFTLIGVLAIHSIKVDTLPIDRALGLISRTTAPAFTLQARAIDAQVTNCAGGICFGDSTAITFQLQREAISNAIGGIIAMIKTIVKQVMRVLQMIKKIFNFFISLVQKFSGTDMSLYGILAAVREIGTLDNTFKDFFTSIQKEFDSISGTGDNTTAQANIRSAAQSTKNVSYAWDACIAGSLAKNEGQGPQGVDVDKLCKIAIDGASNLNAALGIGTAASGVANDIFGTQATTATATSTTGTPNPGSETTSGTTPAGPELSPVSGPLNAIFNGDPDTGKFRTIDAAAKMTEDKKKAEDLAAKKKEQAKASQAWSPQCGLFVGQDKNKFDAKTTKLSFSPVNSSLFKSLDVSSAPSTSSSFLGQNITVSNTVPTNLSFEPAKIDNFDIQALSPEQCSYAQDSAQNAEGAINQANTTTTPAETSGGISAVINALQSIFDLIKTIQDIFQSIMGFINELMQIGQSFMSEFQSFFGGIGNIFSQAGASGPTGQALGVNDIIRQSVGGTPLVAAGPGNAVPIDNGTVSIDDSAISANQDNFIKYSDQSVDCLLDSVKIQATSYTAQYKGNNSTLNTDNLPVIGLNNLNTYTNGSNVPDSVIGASVTDANTPPMSGVTYKKPDGSTGTVSGIPSRSLISAGSATGNLNATYHQCQQSPWGDDNSIDTAGKRLAVYPFDPKYGGPSVYRDGVSNDWRVVNNNMSKDIPEQCYLTNNDLSASEKQSIISALGIQVSFSNNNNGGGQSTSVSDQAWQEAKSRIDDAQRNGRVRWDPDQTLVYQNRSRGGVIVGSGNDKKEVQIKPGKCEISYTKDEVTAALQSRGWNLTTPEVKSFVALVQ